MLLIVRNFNNPLIDLLCNNIKAITGFRTFKLDVLMTVESHNYLSLKVECSKYMQVLLIKIRLDWYVFELNNCNRNIIT